MVGMLSEDMPRPAMLGVDTLVSVLAVDVVTRWRGPRADRRALQVAHHNWNGGRNWGGVTGEAITGIRPMDILVRLLRFGLWLSILRSGYYVTVRWLIRTTDCDTVIPLPLRILAVRDLSFGY